VTPAQGGREKLPQGEGVYRPTVPHTTATGSNMLHHGGLPCSTSPRKWNTCKSNMVGWTAGCAETCLSGAGESWTETYCRNATRRCPSTPIDRPHTPGFRRSGKASRRDQPPTPPCPEHRPAARLRIPARTLGQGCLLLLSLCYPATIFLLPRNTRAAHLLHRPGRRRA
jgi:hypothetical protein